MNIHVDTLEYSNMLVNAGMERAHAEAVAKLQAQTVKDLIDHELVTKDFLSAELKGLELKLRDEIRGEAAKLRDEHRSEAAKLRDEHRSESAKLRDEYRSESAKLREEMRDQGADQRRQTEALMMQIRALQFGGAIAAFALGAITLLARLIR